MFSPDGGFVAATYPGDDIGVWETRTQTRRRIRLLRRYNRAFDHSGQAPLNYVTTAAAISPDGCFVAALGAARDGRNNEVRFLKLWDIADPGRPRRRLMEQTRATPLSGWDVAFAADSRTVASTWHAPTAQARRTASSGDSPRSSAPISPA